MIKLIVAILHVIFSYSHYQVAVVILPKATDISSLVSPDTEFQNINGVDYDETFCDRDFSTPFVYVTAEFARDLLPSDGQFIVGLEDQPNDRPSIYTNGLLCFSKSYTFFLRAYTFTNPTSFVSAKLLMNLQCYNNVN